MNQLVFQSRAHTKIQKHCARQEKYFNVLKVRKILMYLLFKKCYIFQKAIRTGSINSIIGAIHVPYFKL